MNGVITIAIPGGSTGIFKCNVDLKSFPGRYGTHDALADVESIVFITIGADVFISGLVVADDKWRVGSIRTQILTSRSIGIDSDQGLVGIGIWQSPVEITDIVDLFRDWNIVVTKIQRIQDIQFVDLSGKRFPCDLMLVERL